MRPARTSAARTQEVTLWRSGPGEHCGDVLHAPTPARPGLELRRVTWWDGEQRWWLWSGTREDRGDVVTRGAR